MTPQEQPAMAGDPYGRACPLPPVSRANTLTANDEICLSTDGLSLQPPAPPSPDTRVQASNIRCLLNDARVVELRHEEAGRWTSGLFDDLQTLQQVAFDLSPRGNLFVSQNRPHITIKAGNSLGSRALRNDDFSEIVRLPFDLDPVRPPNLPADCAEIAGARAASRRLEAVLTQEGWPPPMRAFSGNGWHLVYRVCLRNDEATRQMLAAIYSGLKSDLSNDAVVLDETVRNPGRVLRLYGTVNRKGLPTNDRPHRRSDCWLPSVWEAVDQRLLHALANRLARRLCGSKERPPHQPSPLHPGADYRTLDIVSWFAYHGLYEHPIEGRKHAVRCPWEHEHSCVNRNDTIIFEADGGWPGFYCHHAHCADRRIRAVMDRFGDAFRFCVD